MGIFAIWHWLIVALVVMLFLAGLPAVAIATAGHVKQLGRRAYAIRAVGLWVASIILSVAIPGLAIVVFEPAEGGDNTHLARLTGLTLMIFIVLIVIQFLIARWSVHRLNDMGQSSG